MAASVSASLLATHCAAAALDQAADGQLNANESCSRPPTSTTPIPPLLEPLALTDLYAHVCVSLAFTPQLDVWRMPGSAASHCGSYTPSPTVAMRLGVSDPAASKAYLSSFLDYFTNVRNYIKYERVFRDNIETSDLIITHVISYGWTTLTEADASGSDTDDGHVSHLQKTGRADQMEHDLIVTMKLIRILSRLDSLAARIGQKHGIKLILKTMKSLPLCMQLQINCSASLANLASVEANRQSMLDEGCIKLVLQNMSKFMSSPAMQAEVCATLANLACHETNAAYIVANGGCHLIIKSMRMHTDMIDLQVQAFHALANLSRPGKDTLEREHFVGILMKSVGAHFNEVELVSAAWHALGSVAHSGINIKDSKEALASMIFDSMQRFESNPTFQITACFAIAHISFNHEGEECTPSGLAGIPVILRIMRKYPLQESLQTTAMFALGTIVMKNERYREFMLESGGIAAVLEAMRRDHSKYETKYEELAIRMASLSLGSPAGGGHSSGGSAGPLLSLDRGGIAPAVEGDSTAGSSLDSLFESDPEIEAQFEFDFQHSSETVLYSRDNTRVQCSKPLLLQLFGSVTLLNLSESAKCRDAIIDSGGVHYMFEATRRVSDHLDLWFIVYYIFTKFTKCGDERVLYMRRKGVPSLCEMSRCKVISLLSKAREDLAAAQPPPSQSSAAASIHSFVPGIARILSRPLSPLFQARSMSSTWSSPSSPSASASTTGSMIPSPSSSSRVGLASLASLSNAPALGPSGTSVGLAGALTTSRPPPAQQALQSATASPLRAAPSVTTALALKTQQLDPSTEFGLDTEIAALDIPPHLQSMLLRAERCSACGSVCFESAIRMYEVIGAKTSSIKKLCSLACAQRDEKFAQRCTFWYSPQDDL